MSAPSTVSPFAPEAFPQMPAVAGVRLATAAAGIRYRGRDDLLLVTLAAGTSAAGVFTRSQTAAAPVAWCRRMLSRGQARALLVNSGNANAFTGEAGHRTVAESATAVSGALGIAAEDVLIASTGVIGEQLPTERIVATIPALKCALGESGWHDAAQAIATTDTFPKGSTRTVRIEDRDVRICGIAKGAGMIAPDMATMLAFVFTDAAIAAPALQTLLTEGVDRSFNCITVDSDTSTNDTLLLFATGAAGHSAITEVGDQRLADFREKLDEVLLDLALQVVRDGEGISKFVTIHVSGGNDDGAARQIALTIANSPLVKTAIAGADANWGRIVAAVGRAGEWIDRDRLTIAIGGIAVARDGAPIAGYDETPVAQHMRGGEIDISVDVGVGDGTATVWTCDLTHEYININASYRS